MRLPPPFPDKNVIKKRIQQGEEAPPALVLPVLAPAGIPNPRQPILAAPAPLSPQIPVPAPLQPQFPFPSVTLPPVPAPEEGRCPQQDQGMSHLPALVPYSRFSCGSNKSGASPWEPPGPTALLAGGQPHCPLEPHCPQVLARGHPCCPQVLARGPCRGSCSSLPAQFQFNPALILPRSSGGEGDRDVL